MTTRSIGDKGEELACRYLINLGYKIKARNYQIRGGEIDIIAQDKDELVFIEVKTRYSHDYGSPLESITPWKIKHMIKTAGFYILKVKWGDRSYRIDVISIDYADSKDNPKIELIKSITS